MLVTGDVNAYGIEEVHIFLLTLDPRICGFFSKPLRGELNDLGGELESILLGFTISSRLVRMVLVELLECADVLNALLLHFTDKLVLRAAEDFIMEVQLLEHVVEDIVFNVNQCTAVLQKLAHVLS